MDSLYEDLHAKTLESIGQLPPGLSESKSETSKFFDTFRRAISGKVRSQSVDSQLTTATNSLRRNANSNSGVVSPILATVGETEDTPKVVNLEVRK